MARPRRSRSRESAGIDPDRLAFPVDARAHGAVGTDHVVAVRVGAAEEPLKPRSSASTRAGRVPRAGARVARTRPARGPRSFVLGGSNCGYDESRIRRRTASLRRAPRARRSTAAGRRRRGAPSTRRRRRSERRTARRCRRRPGAAANAGRCASSPRFDFIHVKMMRRRGVFDFAAERPGGASRDRRGAAPTSPAPGSSRMSPSSFRRSRPRPSRRARGPGRLGRGVGQREQVRREPEVRHAVAAGDRDDLLETSGGSSAPPRRRARRARPSERGPRRSSRTPRTGMFPSSESCLSNGGKASRSVSAK